MFSTSNARTLQYQLNRIEAKLDALLQQADIPPPPDRLTTEVKHLLAENQPIAAIKLVRTTTGMGLAEAKAWIAAIK
jgi:ribosomal protein L7/L12